MKIVILDGYTINPGDLSWSGIGESGELTVYDRTAPELIASRIGNAEIIMTSKCHITKEIMTECKNLKWIGILATGTNMVDMAFATEKGILVTYIPAYSTESVAQLTFSLLLEICNHVGKHGEAVSSGEWNRAEDFCFTLTPQMELSGKTLGIIGFGNIGKKVAKMGESFGMKVLISTAYPDPEFTTDSIRFTDPDQLYALSDIISLHCPLREANKGLINNETINKMKDGVIILNTSRGLLVNETDLAHALKIGKVFAAGLDVLSTEPPSEDNPLIGLENCMITPHIGWITKESRMRLISAAIENLKSYLQGGYLNCINFNE